MRTTLEFHLQSKEWGKLLICRIIPLGDDIWGVFRPLDGTPWGDGIVEVPGEEFSHAMHGNVMPLVRLLGPEPKFQLKRIPAPYRICATHKSCSIYQPARCQPCPKLPDCYTPPNLTQDQVSLATEIALAWRNGFHVVTVNGPEFTL